MLHSEFSVRPAKLDDVPGLVDIDMASFSSVYIDYLENSASLRSDLEEKFAHRLQLLGGDWTSVLERKGRPVGLMTSCPTSKEPESFISWEDTTDNGTLDTTYDPNGKNEYVVTLSVLPEGSQAKGMLFAHQIGQGLKAGFEQAFFESRVPGLYEWMKDEASQSELDFNSLSQEQVHSFAERYFGLTRNINGLEVPYDRLLRLYKELGCNLLKLVPNAYKDTPSMNYGVLCTYNFPDQLGEVIPSRLARQRSIRWMAGMALRSAAHSERIAKIFN